MGMLSKFTKKDEKPEPTSPGSGKHPFAVPEPAEADSDEDSQSGSDYSDDEEEDAGVMGSGSAGYAEQLAEQLRLQAEMPPTYVDKMPFNIASQIAVCANAAVIGFEVDMTCHQLPEFELEPCQDMTGTFWLLKAVFTIIFSVELVLRLLSHGWNRWRFDGMNWFDAFIIFVSLIDMFMSSDLVIFALMRIIRLVRVIRLVRLLRFFKELWIIVAGIGNVMSTLMWITPIGGMLIYICAIFLTEQIWHGGLAEVPLDDSPWEIQNYFGSVSKSMFTLFQILTCDDWSTHIVRPLMHESIVWPIFFIIFILIAYFGITNVILGVVCESVMQLAKLNDEKVASHLKQDEEKLFHGLKLAFIQAGGSSVPKKRIDRGSKRSSAESSDVPRGSKKVSLQGDESSDYSDSDSDSSSENEVTIDKETFVQQMNKASVKDIFALCDIPNDDVEELYDMLDDDNSGDITWTEFHDGCMKIRGDAKGEDLFRLASKVLGCMQHTTSLAKKLQTQDHTLARVLDQVEDLWQGYYDPKNKRTQPVVLDLVKTTRETNKGTRTDLLRKSVTSPHLVKKQQRRGR